MMTKLPISKRVVVIFLFLIIIPFLVLTGYQQIRTSQMLRRYTIEQMMQTAQLYGAQAEEKMTKAESFVNQLRMDENLRTAVGNLNRGRMDGETILTFEQFKDSVSDYAIIGNVQLYSVSITTRQSVICQINNVRSSILNLPLEQQDWFQTAVSAQGRLCWSGISFEKKGAILSIGCALNGNDNLDAGIVGTINAAFSTNWLFPQLDKSETEAFLAFYQAGTDAIYGADDADGELLAAVNQLLTGGKEECDVLWGGEPYYMVLKALERNGWVILYGVPAGRMTKVILSSSAVFLAVSLACLAAILLFLFHMQMRLLRPLEDAIAFINENTLQQVELQSDAHGYPEIRIMRQRAALYASNQRAAEISLRSMSRQRDIAQLKRLQMQINPHFLYNTLNSIKVLTDTGRASDASEMIHHLVHVLNACMDRSGAIVTLSEEMQSLRHYLAIQQTVYGETVTFIENMKPELDDCEIPNFILQPIVENCLQHGLDLARQNNRIAISDREEDGALVIEIRDNGIGIAPEKLEQLRQDMENETPTAHIGFCSVHQRIRLTCGKPYGLTLYSDLGDGTRVLIRLPLDLDAT